MNFQRKRHSIFFKFHCVLHGRPLFFVLLALNVTLLLLTVPQNVEAAKRRVIFQLANLRQWADLEYSYDGRTIDSQQSNNRHSQEHEFVESYHLGVDYALLSRRLANGTLELDLGLNQNYQIDRGTLDQEDNSYGLNLEYMFDMLLFERRFYPITLMANQTQERVAAPFSQSYDLLNSTYSAGMSLRNRVFPTQLNYRHYETETAGLSRDNHQIADELNLDASFDTGEISNTRLKARSSSRSSNIEGTVATNETESFELEGRNLLTWTAFTHNQTLSSNYSRQRDTGSYELQTELWDERLDLQLGKALDTGLSYRYNDTETSVQNRCEKRGEAWVEHQLFKSLTSRYQYNINRTNYSAGEDSTWQQQLSFSYTKELPQQSRLNLSYSYGYGETDRNLDDSQLVTIDEQLQVQVASNFLLNPDIIENSVVVFDENRTTQYVEGVDYQLVQVGRRLELLFSLPFPTPNGIHLGDTLSVDYAYRVNSSIEYSTTTNSASASIGLFNHRYRVYSSLSQTGQELIDGVADVYPLTESTFAQVGFESNPGTYSFGSSYQYQDSSISTDKTLEAFVNYIHEKKSRVLNMRLTERYTSTRQNESWEGAVASASNNNSLLLNVDYRRQLGRNRTINLRGQIIDIRGENNDQDDIFLGAVFESRWYKFQVRISADVTWQIFDQSTSRNDRVSIAFRRYF